MSLKTVWTNPIDRYPRWEQREILSYSDHLSADNQEKINSIIHAFKNNSEFSWKGLTLNDEAVLQKELRLNQIGINCYGLDDFPETILELNKVTYKLPTSDYIRHIYYKHREALTEILKQLTNPSLFNLILVLIGLWYFNSTLVIPALVLSLFIYNLVIIVMHEGWSHKFVTPKNKALAFVFDLLAYMSEFTLEAIWATHPKYSWSTDHTNHHKNWKEDLAHQRSHWFTVLFLQSYNIGTDKKKEKLSSTMELTLLDKHYRIVVVLMNLVLLTVLGPLYYFYFVFLQGWLFWRWKKFFNELSTHYGQTDWRQDRDRPWLFPLCANAGYHISHHLTNNLIILGGGGIKKYFSIQYWFITLLFRVRAGVKII